MDFLEFLKLNAQEVGGELDLFLKGFISVSKEINQKFGPLLNAFRDSCQGGKRVRAALIRLGYRLGEGDVKYEEDVLRVAAGYEIFQTAILSHDDIIDKDTLRRGNPSLYMRLGGDHYGISQAIVLSDIGFFLCMKAINETKFPDSIKNQAVSSFTDTFLKTGLGEMLDVEISFKGDVDIKDVETVNLLKTADYSVVGPLRLGLILSGGKHLLKNIELFGRLLGVAFQLQDDLLGIFGSEEETGKSAISDIKEGKTTLLFLTALKKANPVQKDILNKLYGKDNLSRDEVGKVRSVFLNTGAVDHCRQESIRLTNLAKEEIGLMDISDENRNLLLQMADFLIERTK